MSKTRDVLVSIFGATVAGVSVYFVDRYLAAKQSASEASQQNTPSLGISNELAAEQFAEAISATNTSNSLFGSPETGSTPVTTQPTTTTSSGSCNGDCGATASPITATPQPTAAQASIAQSLANIASLSQNNHINYNVQLSPTPGQ
jgi:hypothetical protein